MKNQVLQFYNNLTSNEQKNIVVDYINGAANEIIASSSFERLPENMRTDILEGNNREKINAVISCAIEIGKAMCKFDKESRTLKVNNKSNLINCFAVFMIGCVEQSTNKTGVMSLSFINGDASVNEYDNALTQLNTLFGVERLSNVSKSSPSQSSYSKEIEKIINMLYSKWLEIPLKARKLILPITAGVLVLFVIIGVTAKEVSKRKAESNNTAYYGEIYDSYGNEEEDTENFKTDIPEPEQQILREYEIVDADDFVAGRAWVEYKEVDEDNRTLTYKALINKSGEILYSLCVDTLEEKAENGENDFEGIDDIWHGLETEVFENGTAAYYHTNGSKMANGLVLVGETGKVVYRSDDNDDTTNYYFLAYGEDKFLILKNVADFSSSSYSVIVLDGKGNILDTIDGEFNEAEYIGNNYFKLKNESFSIYDANTKSVISVLPYSDYISGTYCKTINDFRIFRESSYFYCVPTSAFNSPEAFESCLENERIIEIYWSDFGEDGIHSNIIDANNKEYYNLDGSFVCRAPGFPEGTYVENYGNFNGGFCAVTVSGKDGKRYVIVFDKSGNLKYDPVKLGPICDEHEPERNIKQYKGYVFVCDHKSITPEGKIVDTNSLPKDVLSQFKGAKDGLIIKYDKKYTYQDIYENIVFDTVKLTDNSVVEGEQLTKAATTTTTTATTKSYNSYRKISRFSIIGKWKSVGSYGFGQAQPGAIIVFDGVNCNFYSPSDTYAITPNGDYYTLECTSFLFAETVTFTVKTIDNDHIDIYYGSSVTELVRVQ